MHGSDTISGETSNRRAAECGRDRSLDVWLRDSLACAYDGVLSEELPASWLSMISGGGKTGG